jgi:hypothetical protein
MRKSKTGRDKGGKGTNLDGLDGVLDLKQTTLWRESIDTAVVFGTAENNPTPQSKNNS